MKKVNRAIRFNQNAWLKRYIENAKNGFEKDFFKLIDNAIFGNTMENVRKRTDINLAITEAKENYLVSEPDYHITIFS